MSQAKIKVSVLYPRSENSTFNMDYYLNNHLPMVGKLFTETKSSEMEKGHSGPMPGSESAYMAAASLYFDKVEDFTSVFAANAKP